VGRFLRHGVHVDLLYRRDCVQSIKSFKNLSAPEQKSVSEEKET